MKDKQERQAKQLQEIQALASNFNREMWATITHILKRKIEQYKTKRELSFWSLTDLEAKIVKAREEELEAVIRLPEVYANSYEALKKENKKLNEDIRAYAQRLKEAGS